MLVAAGLLAWVLGGVETVRAAELWSDGDASVQLDTTVQFTGLRRLTPPQSRLLANPNADDGDRAFASGAASNRTDVFSELDADYGSLGVRFSGAFWYDPVYFNRTANNSPATFNPFTVPNDKFTRSVRTLEGLTNRSSIGAMTAADGPDSAASSPTVIFAWSSSISSRKSRGMDTK